jgi:hypothetical protein
MALKQTQALGGNAPFELFHPAQARELEIGGDLRQRIQNEIALHYPGMRQRQLRLRAVLASISKEIKIDDTGPPALVLRGTAHGRLDGTQLVKQCQRVELLT